MPKTNRTTAVMSTSLKAAMNLKGNYPQLEVLDLIYSGTDVCCFIGQFGDGTMRSICNNNDFADRIDPNDPGISKAWSKNSLAAWLSSHYNATDYQESLQGANWTISFRVNGILHSGTSNNDAMALAMAVTSLLAL